MVLFLNLAGEIAVINVTGNKLLEAYWVIYCLLQLWIRFKLSVNELLCIAIKFLPKGWAKIGLS